jgi:hypothetical protein
VQCVRPFTGVTPYVYKGGGGGGMGQGAFGSRHYAAAFQPPVYQVSRLPSCALQSCGLLLVNMLLLLNIMLLHDGWCCPGAAAVLTSRRVIQSCERRPPLQFPPSSTGWSDPPAHRPQTVGAASNVQTLSATSTVPCCWLLVACPCLDTLQLLICWRAFCRWLNLQCCAAM